MAVQKMKNNKFSILLLIICLFVLILIALSYYSNPADGLLANTISSIAQSIKTSKQATSKDLGTVSSKLGFSLKYPYKEVGAMWGDDEYFPVGREDVEEVRSLGIL